MRLTKDIFIEKSKLCHGDKYDYSKVEYKNMKSKVIITCVNGHVFEQIPQKHINGSGCKQCFFDSRKSTKEYFINKSIILHGNKYDYSKVIYINDRTNITIICPEHGEFVQIPNSHFKGKGCIKCGLLKRSISRKNDSCELISKFKEKHGDKYDYSKMEYVKMRNKINIKCKIHNFEFYQSPIKHLESKTGGCPKCNSIGKGTMPNDIFVEKANIIHSNKYKYETDYIKSNKKIKIKCKKHGVFEMTPNAHLGGEGCRVCNRNGGVIENIWLDLFNISRDFRQYKIDTFFVDGFDPINKIVYEFYGDFWHGNPNIYNSDGIKYGELYNRTIYREEMLKSKGYKVVSIWESDFKKQNNI